MYCFSHRADIKKLLSLISLSLFSAARLLAAADGNGPLPQPVFVTDDDRIDQKVPYVTLKWQLAEEIEGDAETGFELEVASSQDFLDSTSRYRGPDTASFISGLAEGEYFFRVRSFKDDAVSAWSEPLHVSIQYDSLTQALMLFGIGAVVSIATVALVVVGDRRTRKEDADS